MLNGIINIYKEKGYTSHDVVAKLRGITKQKKIGHTGTLDPEATGVLPVCLGNATKLCDLFLTKEKEYIAKVQLGISTDTQDLTGTVLETRPVQVTKEQLEKVLQEFVGEYEQIPPMYSALKVGGKKLYELAREGKEVERKARTVTIYELELLEYTLPTFSVRVRCSKGTYIRTLCYDIGVRLGTLAAMEELERTKSGPFSLETALKLQEVQQLMEAYKEAEKKEAPEFLLPVESFFQECSSLRLQKEYEKLIYNGNPFTNSHLRAEFQQKERKDKEKYRVYAEGERLLGIYEYQKEKGRFYPYKMFLE